MGFSHHCLRRLTWLNPFADIAGKGYQITQSLFAIGSGGFFGTGLGIGYPHFIPNVATDFIFSAICAVPEFPGATKSFLHNGLCMIFQANVCSLPPEPKIRMFIVVLFVAKVKFMP